MNAYLCIDIKTFYASVECCKRHLDPFKDHLVVADASRGKGALCLAITPSLKALGIKNRCRLYEIPQHIQYIIAPPRMQLYMEYAADIYEIYLKYVSKEDIHVYSIDEAFLDITGYLKLYKKTPTQIARMILDDLYQTLGIYATAGIGTNLYLAKIALDLIAKHSDNFIGVLNEEYYKKYLWHYQPLTDFWQIGPGIARRLASKNIYTMYDIAHHPSYELYDEFGINARYLIDHAWGREPTTIAEIKDYTPIHQSVSHSQILFKDYTYDNALVVLKEMVELKVLDLVDKRLVSDCISLCIGYSKNIHKHTGGSIKIEVKTNSYKIFKERFELLYRKTTVDYPIRSIAIGFHNVLDEHYETYTLFSDVEALEEEKHVNQAVVRLRSKYGKNAMLKGMNLLEDATTKTRNTLIGGHNAG